jgi:hypothetical protein
MHARNTAHFETACLSPGACLSATATAAAASTGSALLLRLTISSSLLIAHQALGEHRQLRGADAARAVHHQLVRARLGRHELVCLDQLREVRLLRAVCPPRILGAHCRRQRSSSISRQTHPAYHQPSVGVGDRAPTRSAGELRYAGGGCHGLHAVSHRSGAAAAWS